MYAAHFGHYNVIKVLIDHGGSVNVQEWVRGRTPLMLAASCGHTRCLEVLITLGGADIDLVDFEGHNAAYYAIHSGHGRNKIIAKLLRIHQKPRSVSRPRPVTKTVNPDIVVTQVTQDVKSDQNSASSTESSSPLLASSPHQNDCLYSPYLNASSSFSSDHSVSFFGASRTPPIGGDSSLESSLTSSYHRSLLRWLLKERETLKKENHELRKEILRLEALTQ